MEKKLADQIKRLGSVLSGLANIVEEIDKEESVKNKRRCDCANQTPYSPCPPCRSCPLQLAYLSYQYPYPYPVLVLRPPCEDERRKQSSNNISEDENSKRRDSNKPQKQSQTGNEEDNNSGSLCSNGPQCQANRNEGDNNCDSEPRRQSKNLHEGDNNSDSFNNNGTGKQWMNANEGDNISGSFYNNYSANNNYGDKCDCPCCKENTGSVDDKPCCCCVEPGAFNTNSESNRRSNVSENRRSISRNECYCRSGDYRKRKTDLYSVKAYND